MATVPDDATSAGLPARARDGSDPGGLRIPGQPSRFARREPLFIGWLFVGSFLVLWQLVAWLRLVPPLFLPGPLDILDAFRVLGGFDKAGAYLAAHPLDIPGYFRTLFTQGPIWHDIWVSGQELVCGYGLAVLVGLPTGLLMGWYKRVNYALEPFVNFFYSAPRIALVPLMVIWFGIGIWSKVAVIFLGAFFPIVINTMTGVQNLDPNLIKMARSFGATDTQIFRTLALPGSVPFILAGLRLGVGHALIGVVAGELIAAQAGVGLMMAKAAATFQTGKVFAGLIIIAGTGILINLILQRIERRFQAWKSNR